MGVERTCCLGSACAPCHFAHPMGHLGHNVCPSLAVIVDVQSYPYRALQPLVDHSGDQHLKRLQGATVFPDEDAFLITPDFEMESPFSQKPFHLWSDSHSL